MLPIIGIIVLVVIGGVLARAASRPNEFRVERTVSIAAPPEKIAPNISDLHAWTAWSPYEHLDPNMRREYSGAPSGRGAVYRWEGNGKAGKGRMEILDAATPEKVALKLEFEKPFKANNLVDFILVPAGGVTNVTWAMYGPSSFMNKVMGVVVNMDKLVGRDFETGLQNLKRVVEA